MIQKRLGACLHDAFWAPWKDKERAKILGAGILGSLGAGAQALVLNYGLAGRGLGVTAPFQIMRQGFLGLVGVPLALWCVAQGGGRSKIFALQAAGLGILVGGGDSAFALATGFFLSSAPMWALYSAAYAQRQSQANHGYETALSSFMLILSGAAGSWGGGVLMDRGAEGIALFGGTALLLLAGQLLFRRSTRRLDFGAIARSLRWRSPSVRFSVFAGVLNTLSDASIPIWFRVIGLTAGAAGGFLAVRILLTFLLTPLVGRLIQKSPLRAGWAGGATLVGGWFMLYLAKADSLWMTPALVSLSIASNLINPAETSRWYKRRSAEGIVAREALLAIGRAPTFLFALPAIFYAPASFPLVGVTLSLLFLFVLRKPRSL